MELRDNWALGGEVHVAAVKAVRLEGGCKGRAGQQVSVHEANFALHLGAAAGGQPCALAVAEFFAGAWRSCKMGLARPHALGQCVG